MESNLDDGEIGESTSLVTLLSPALAFACEKTQLQAVAKVYGAEVWITPKYHCEIAGVGIEYAWAASKSHYRRIPFEEKRTKDLFKAAVKRSLAILILTKETVRKCDR
jgi:hypothetical protein